MRFFAAIMLAWTCATGAASPAIAEDAPIRIAGATTVDAEAVIELVKGTPGLVIVDSRKSEDFVTGAIEGAVQLTDAEMTQERLHNLAPNLGTPLLFYCNGVKCGRAAKAVSKAVEWGYLRVYYYALGIVDWDRLGLPLVVAERMTR